MQHKVELKVEGMTCDGCVRSVEKKLEGVSGVTAAKVNLEEGKATVEYDAERADLLQLTTAVEDIGFRASLLL